MDIQTFSKTYWYIWFLAVLFIIIILLINVVGLILYRKRRQRFFNQSNQINNTIPMRETSTVSTINVNKSKYRKLSVPSTITSDFSLTNTRSCPSSYLTNPLHKITTIRELSENIQLEEINELSLEDFRRQALKEHNSTRARFNKSPLKLSESLNISAQHWAEQCAQTNVILPSQPKWRLQYKEQPLGENIISIKSPDVLDGIHFTSLLMANGDHRILNELSTEVGFGRAHNVDIQSQWIGVAHYYPYRQLTSVQS